MIDQNKKPQFKHTCSHCAHIGTNVGADFYLCNNNHLAFEHGLVDLIIVGRHGNKSHHWEWDRLKACKDDEEEVWREAYQLVTTKFLKEEEI